MTNSASLRFRRSLARRASARADRLALLNDQLLRLKLRKPARRASDLLMQVIGRFHRVPRSASSDNLD